MNLPNPITQSERHWVLKLALVLVVFTLLPYLLAYALEGESWRFTGFLIAVEDGNSYIAKMLGGTYGAWLFRTPYTTIAQRGIFLYPIYLLLGKLASPPGVHEQLVALFHLFRILAVLLMTLATYDFIACFVRSVKTRRLATLLGLLGGGLGWVLTVLGHSEWLGSLPLEYYSPETFGFLSLFGLPHLALARALFLWGLVILLRAVFDPRAGWVQPGLRIGLLWLLCGLSQPMTGLLALALAGLYVLALGLWYKLAPTQASWANWLSILKLVILAGVFSIPLAGYNLYTMISDPFLQAWTVQNWLPSPHPLHYLLAYGLVLPYAWLGWNALRQAIPEWAVFATSWILILPILAYLPFNLQRRLVEGGWVLLVALAALGLEKLLTKPAQLASPGRRLRVQLPLFLAFPSTVILFAGALLTATQLRQPIFRPVDEVILFNRLAAEAQPGQVMLADYPTGNALPAWAPLRVVIGHGPETIDLAELRPQITRFYEAGTNDIERQTFLQNQSVDYVFLGPHERALSGIHAWDPSLAGYLAPWMTEGEHAVYRVLNPVTASEVSP
jgi:hypothetical protein